MYVCNCNGLREREVSAAITEGAQTPCQVYERLGCAPRCGRCRIDMQRMIEDRAAATRLAAE